VLFLRNGAAPEGLEAPEFRMEEAAGIEEARNILGEAVLGGDPFSLCIVCWDGATGYEGLTTMVAESPDLFLVLKGPAERLPKLSALGDGISSDRVVCLEEPIVPSALRSVARHLAARWTRERAQRDAARALLPKEGTIDSDLETDRRRLDMIFQIVERLHAGRSLREAFLGTMADMARFLGATTASLLLLENGDQLRVVEALGPNRDRIWGKTFPLAQSRIARHALAAGRPVLIADMRDDEQFGESDGEMRFRSRSILCVPVISRKRPIAVLNFGGAASDVSFSERDRELVVTLARQVAAALEKDTLLEQLQTAVSGSIRALAYAIEAKDPYTRGHSDRVTHYAVLTAVKLGMPPPEVENLKQAAILHDIGKIGVPGDVLHKPGKLDDLEYRIIQRHPEIGIGIVRQIGAMDATLPIIQAHHERHDGSGYPNKIKGAEIPLGARIIAVADAYDAMTSDRPYRRGMEVEAATAEIDRCIGTQFDPVVGEVFLHNVAHWPFGEVEKYKFFSV
jgi:putative nucleotidyltransferase with HDIG domain